jgi:hypothetical protein
MPEGETEREIRDKENGERRGKKTKRVLAKAAVATLGISSLRSSNDVDDQNPLPSSDDGITVRGSDSDHEPTERAKRREQQFANKRLGRREVKRKGFDTTTMPCSWPNEGGPNLSFPPEDVLTSADEGTATGGETEGDHVTDDDEWMAESNDIVKATDKIEASIDEEAAAHHNRGDRTPWVVDRTTAANVDGGRMVTGKSKRAYRKLMTALRKSNEVRDSDLSDSPEMLTSPSPSSRVMSGPLGADNGSHRSKYVRPLFPFPACVARPVGKAEISREPKAKEALQKEWDRLIARGVWDTNPGSVKEWRDVGRCCTT